MAAPGPAGAQGVHFSFFAGGNSWESSGEGTVVRRSCQHGAEGPGRSGVLQGWAQGGTQLPAHPARAGAAQGLPAAGADPSPPWSRSQPAEPGPAPIPAPGGSGEFLPWLPGTGAGRSPAPVSQPAPPMGKNKQAGRLLRSFWLRVYHRMCWALDVPRSAALNTWTWFLRYVLSRAQL